MKKVPETYNTNGTVKRWKFVKEEEKTFKGKKLDDKLKGKTIPSEDTHIGVDLHKDGDIDYFRKKRSKK